MDLAKFSIYCKSGTCFRNIEINNNCVFKTKQSKCLTLLSKVKLNFKIPINLSSDEKWIYVRDYVRSRDVSCRIWNILTKNERTAVMLEDSYSYLSKFLDSAHIIARSQNLKLKLDPNNLVLVNRYFHQLLDSYLSPFRKRITSSERILWFRKAFKGK